MRTFLLASLVVAFAFPSAAAETTLRAGIARRDITPKEPVPMWGYGGRRDLLSQGVFDNLQATALVLRVGDKKMAIVGLDLGRSPGEVSLGRIRQRLAKAGIGFSFIAGSHTHHGPVMELTDAPGRGRERFGTTLKYYRQMEDAIVTAALEADKKSVPVQLAAGSVELEGFNRNRHSKTEPKPVDRQLAVLRLDDASGKTRALLVNFAAHPTMISAAKMKFSADYIGGLRAEVEKQIGAPMVFMQGFTGDLSANRGARRDHRDFGRALGVEVVKLAKSLQPAPTKKIKLQWHEQRFTFASRINLKNPYNRLLYSLAFFPELVNNFIDDYAEGVRPRLGIAMLGDDIGFVGLSGEPFCNHALRLRARARVPHLFCFGYANGYHQYFPTIEAVAEGGYGADNRVSPVEVGAGEKMMNVALQRLFKMRGKLKPR
jgi:neutral ceramidase